MTGFDLEQDWTAARCQRLLRPLASKIASLAKENTCNPSRRLSPPSSDSSNTTQEPELWRSDRARKPVRRTYSARATEQEKRKIASGSNFCFPVENTTSTQPGRVDIPTPVISRARVSVKASKLLPEGLAEGPKSQPPQRLKLAYGFKETSDARLSKKLRELRRITPQSTCNVYEGLYNALEALLKATRPPAPSSPCSRRSLLSTCLRAIPTYIKDQQTLLYAEARTRGIPSSDIRNMTAEIYEELEALGSSASGWRHLRITVRTHGLAFITDAIASGLIDTQVTDILVDLCVQSGSYDAAEILLSALLSNQSYPEPQTANSTFKGDPKLQPLSILCTFSRDTRGTSFLCRQMLNMITDGRLPISWLATRPFVAVWIAAMEAISSPTDGVEALRFMETAFTMIANDGVKINSANGSAQMAELSTALENTFSSALVTLTAMSILSHESAIQETTPENAAVNHAYEHIISSLRDSILFEPSKAWSTYTTLAMMATILYSFSKEILSTSSMDLFKGMLLSASRSSDPLSAVSPCYKEVVMYITSIARCCGRALKVAGFEYLKQIHENFRILGMYLTKEEGKIVSRWILDSTNAFVKESVFDLRHLDYAEELNLKSQEELIRPSPSRDISASGNERTGFRWEEGIGEWVTATPALEKLCRTHSYHEPDSERTRMPFYEEIRASSIAEGTNWPASSDAVWRGESVIHGQELNGLPTPSPEHSSAANSNCIESPTELRKRPRKQSYHNSSDDELSETLPMKGTSTSSSQEPVSKRYKLKRLTSVRRGEDSEDELCA